MHIPDGVITSGPVLAATWVVGAGGIALASRPFFRGLDETRTPLIGVLGAFIFAAQMVNFPLIGAPVSAHLVGTGLLTALLGPAVAIIVQSAVLLAQAILFQDGGLTAYGANVMNLAVLPAVAGAAVLSGWPKRWRAAPIAIAVASAAGIVLATVGCGLQFILSGEVDPEFFLTGLFTAQLVVAVAEGVIVALVWIALRQRFGGELTVWPTPSESGPRSGKGWVLALSFLVCAAGATVASQSPDTLEHFLEETGVEASEPAPAPLPDYSVEGVSSEILSTFLAGSAGLLATLGLLSLIGAVRRRGAPGSPTETVDAPRVD